jgi:hypothetical protein
MTEQMMYSRWRMTSGVGVIKNLKNVSPGGDESPGEIMLGASHYNNTHLSISLMLFLKLAGVVLL